MDVNGKYIKDENGNIISPIVSDKTTYDYSNNPLNYNEAYFAAHLSSNKSYSTESTIIWSTLDYYKNISLSQGVFTISYSGIYIVELHLHLYSTSQVGRCFSSIVSSNNYDNSKGCFNTTYRSTDIWLTYDTNTNHGNDPTIHDTFIVRLLSGASILTKIHPITNTAVNLLGTNSTSKVYENTYINIKRIGSL